MSCCADEGWPEEIKPNGECPECGEPTVDGDSWEYCSYSPEQCKLCGSRPCDQSC